MSSIPNSILDISERVTIDVNLNNLSDRQLKNLSNMVTRGVVPAYSNVATAVIARLLLSRYDVPMITYSRYQLMWKNLKPDNSLFKLLTATAALEKLTFDPATSSWKVASIQKLIDIGSLTPHTHDVLINSVSHDNRKKLTKQITADITPNHPLMVLMEKIVSREETRLQIGADEWKHL